MPLFKRGRGTLPKHKPGRHTDETNRLEKAIIADIRRSGDIKSAESLASGANFIRRVGVPDTSTKIVKAVEKLFGVKVVFVQVDKARANIFNGVFLGGNP